MRREKEEKRGREKEGLSFASEYQEDRLRVRGVILYTWAKKREGGGKKGDGKRKRPPS